jgi:hypothetical protein
MVLANPTHMYTDHPLGSTQLLGSNPAPKPSTMTKLCSCVLRVLHR